MILLLFLLKGRYWMRDLVLSAKSLLIECLFGSVRAALFQKALRVASVTSANQVRLQVPCLLILL
jgi:hypothetical protein